MIFGTSIRVKKAAHSTYRSKGPASTKHHRINIWQLTLTQHWHWLVTSIRNTKSSVPDYGCYRNYAQSWMYKPQKWFAQILSFPAFTHCGTVNLNPSRTSLGNLDRIHEQAVGIITKTSLMRGNVMLPNSQNIYHKAATSTYD